MEQTKRAIPGPMTEKLKHLKIEEAILSVASSIDQAANLLCRITGEDRPVHVDGNENRREPDMLETLNTAADKLHAEVDRLNNTINRIESALFE